jgi:ankyrin repeat protein
VNWRETRDYYGWDIPMLSFQQIIVALWNANLDGVQQVIETYPDLLEADELLQTASRPPGHWHRGHGGDVPEDQGRDGQRAEVVTWLIAQGANPNRRSRRRQDTGLHQAARFGLTETVRAQLVGEADPNVQAKDGATPLHRATRHGYPSTIEALLAGGADPEIADKRGVTSTALAKKSPRNTDN